MTAEQLLVVMSRVLAKYPQATIRVSGRLLYVDDIGRSIVVIDTRTGEYNILNGVEL